MGNKRIVEYTTENPVYNEARTMNRIALITTFIILVLTYVY